MPPEVKTNGQTDSVLLDGLEAFTDAGQDLARSSAKLFDGTVNEAASELQGSIKRLQHKGYRDKDVTQSLTKQLESIRINYELLSQRMNDEVNALGGGTFAITLFGRTTAGKSTLMTILTHGDGSQIGNGSQRTTRDVRTYDYHGLKVTEVLRHLREARTRISRLQPPSRATSFCFSSPMMHPSKARRSSLAV